MSIVGKIPAVVREVTRGRREVRVEIPGITDGAEILPLAQICYPIGDKSAHTEIRMLPGDGVWVEFECGDARYPIIVGYRNPNVGNVIGWRRWHHENIETEADTAQIHTAGSDYKINAEDVTITATSSITLDAGATISISAGEKILLQVGGSTFELSAAGIKQVSATNTMQGPLVQTGGDITSDGVSVQTHAHIGNLGNPTSAPIRA